MNLSLLDQAAGQSGGMLSMAMPFIMLAVMFLIMYLLIIRTQKKRDKETQAMRNNIQVGDEVVTAGGIVGRVVNIKEDTIVLETGSDRSKIRIKRWAVQSNESLSNV